MGNNPSTPQQRARPLPAASPRVQQQSSQRRKKSIELIEEPSLGFTPLKGSTAAEDDEPAGTLRGAMQGKAAHVVYGPRRPGGSSVPAAPQSLPTSTAVGRPVSIAMPARGAMAPVPIPEGVELQSEYKASPRLTSDVLLSSDQMPVIVSPMSDEGPKESPFHPAVPVSLASTISSITSPTLPATSLLPPHSSDPFPPTHAPIDTIQAPPVPTSELPLSADKIPSGTSVLMSPPQPSTPLGGPTTAAVLLPPNLFNAPVAAIPIPLVSVPSPTIAASLVAAAVDVGAGSEGVPTLIKWKDEDGQGVDAQGRPVGPKEVFVTGTFAKGWKTKIELQKASAGDFSALISLPPGPHRLKFIVDKEWKASKHLQLATDADGNLINYLHVSGAPTTSKPLWSSQFTMPNEDDDPVGDVLPADDDDEWTTEIPAELVEWGELEYPPPGVPPPSLPAQLEKGPLNHAAYVTHGSGDDNSILPKPDYSVINHLAASPIKGGFLSVGVTTRYKRKFVTIVYYKALST